MPSRHIRLLFSPSAFRTAARYSPPSSPSNHSLRKSFILPIVAPALGILAMLFLLFLYWYRKRLKQRSSKTSPDDGAAFNLQKFKYRQLKMATKSFSQAQKLGKGGFGIVYRGVLRNGKEVAVKKLDLSSLQGEREFQNELSICGGLNSPYVVSLLGYCTHGKTVRLLVYECMQNRSLQEALFEKGYPVHLDWEKRFKIIFDTAKALEFLHLECSPPIIHGDVKPSNILLDSQFSARIADFGLARLKNEEFCVDSARVSISSEKVRPDTPDRFRIGTPEKLKFGTPDRYSTGTAEMSRSSTKNALSELSAKFAAEVVTEKKKVEEKSFIVDVPAAEALREIPMANGVSVVCSPNHSSVQLVTSENLPEEVAETSISTSVHEGLSDPVMQENGCTKVTTIVPKETVASGAEDSDSWSKACPSEGCTTDDVVNIDRPRDVRRLPLNREVAQEKLSGKDWWWRQDASGESSGRDYVMDWISSEFRVSSRNGSDKNEEIVPVEENCSGAKGQTSRFRPLDANGERSRENKNTQVNKKEKKAKPKHRKSREWWKDEYFAELNSKNKSYRAGKLKTDKERTTNKRKDFQSGDLSGYIGETFQSRSRDLMRDYHSGDFSLRKGKERRAKGSDLWSGELVNRQFSCDLLNRPLSGDLSRSGELVSRDVSSTTSMRGTVCYVAPEYGGSGILSERSDIYSFGVLMLVILSGRRPIQVTASPMKDFERANLISWARSLSQSGKLLDLMDESLHVQYDREKANLCITLALLCLQRVPARRPTIANVVKILSGEIAAPSLPLELSPSPPAKKTCRSPLTKPKEHPVQAETP